MKIVYLCSGAVAAAAGLSFVTKKEAESIGNKDSQQLQPVQCSSAKTPKQNCELKTWIVKKCEIEMEKSGAPGLLIGVSVDGQTIFSSGLGYADIENSIPCRSSTVMRIASISKSLTMAAVAKAYEEGKIDIDKSVQSYLPNFPTKTCNGKEVTITTRQLVSHLGGIRHYDKRKINDKEECELNKKEEKKKEGDEFEKKEYYLKESFKTVEDALELFKHDELYHEPGSDFLYTTHGWTLVSAVLEKAVGKDFKKIMTQLFSTLGLKNTRFDENEPIIMNRARYYVRNKRGKLINAPYVDNSYKWAGGGFVSTAQDLVKFGNALLYSYQRADPHPSFKSPLPGFLESSTVKMLWTPVDKTQKDPDKDTSYGMGWVVVPTKQQIAFGDERKFHVYHTGGAVGASSVLLVLPSETTKEFPRGVVVALITNMQGVGLNNLALEIAQEVEKWYIDGK